MSQKNKDIIKHLDRFIKENPEKHKKMVESMSAEDSDQPTTEEYFASMGGVPINNGWYTFKDTDVEWPDHDIGMLGMLKDSNGEKFKGEIRWNVKTQKLHLVDGRPIDETDYEVTHIQPFPDDPIR